MRIAQLGEGHIGASGGKYLFGLHTELEKLEKTDLYYFDARENLPLGLVPKRVVTPTTFGAFGGLKFSALPDFVKRRKSIPRGYDVYHATWPGLWSYVPPSENSAVTVHDLSGLIPSMAASWTYFLSFTRWMHNAKSAKLFIADSHNTARDLVNMCGISPDRIHVAYLGSGPVFRRRNSSRRELNLDEGGQLLVHVGREERRKNIGFLFSVIRYLRRSFPKLTLVRVGEKKSSSERLIGELGLQDCVRYVSFVDDERLAILYSAADLMIFPSTYEGFGLPLVEAMACGCPLLGSRMGSIPEVIGDSQPMLVPNDPKEWAEAAGKVLESESYRDELSARGIRRAREFTWDRCAQETLRAFREHFG